MSAVCCLRTFWDKPSVCVHIDPVFYRLFQTFCHSLAGPATSTQLPLIYIPIHTGRQGQGVNMASTRQRAL